MEPKSIDGVNFRDGYGNYWGTQISIDMAFETRDPKVFLYIANYGTSVEPLRTSSHALIQRRRSDDGWRDSSAATEGGCLASVIDLAHKFAGKYGLERLTQITVDQLPK